MPGVIISGCFGLVVAVVTGIFLIVANDDSANGGGQSAASTINPQMGRRYRPAAGLFWKERTAPQTLVWVLDYDPTDGSYFQVNEYPIPVVGGKWIQVNRPIGDEHDEIGTV